MERNRRNRNKARSLKERVPKRSYRSSSQQGRGEDTLILCGQSRGFGFVEMPEQSRAQAAIKGLNGKDFMGKQISVNEARPRTDRGRSGG